LKIAAKVDRVDQEYFEAKIKPLLKHPGVEFIGEITDREKNEFLGNAYAYIFPIDWPEPFGLTMIEAMACGAPTIAFRCGSVPELMTEKVTGFVVDDLESTVASVARIPEIDRRAYRACFEKRFTAQRMSAEYVSLYQRYVGEVDEREMLEYEGTPPAILQLEGFPLGDIIRFQDKFYVLASSSLADNRTRVLKYGETFGVFNRYGDIETVGRGRLGFFYVETRHLSRMTLRLDGQTPLLLASTVRDDNAFLSVDLTNVDTGTRPDIPRGTVHLYRSNFWTREFVTSNSG
jgi:N-terminal domain of (some) glycogen debranching enzymes/Glycosyl transferases group 1